MQHLTTCPKLRLHDLKCGVLAVASLLSQLPLAGERFALCRLAASLLLAWARGVAPGATVEFRHYRAAVANLPFQGKR